MTHPPTSFSEWFQKNNPLYLLSVVMMLAGLYLAGSELETGNVSPMLVSGFFAIQNLYELLMVGMALYLLKNRIQPEHGKLLLIFVLLFLGDLTFYQVRISGLSATAGALATTIYIILAAIKFAAVIKVLNLTLHRTRIFYIFSAFIMIWVAPKIAYLMIDSIGSESLSYFDGSYVFYSLWLIAGLIHLPLIIENWRTNTLATACENPSLGNETSFWRWLIIFPFIMLPVHLFLHVMSESYRVLGPTLPAAAVIAPWLLGAAFFAQTLWRHHLESDAQLNFIDSAIMLSFMATVMFTSPVFNLPAVINHVLLAAGMLVTGFTRGNYVNLVGMTAACSWYGGNELWKGATSAVQYGSKLSRTTWAGILMLASFILLFAGFIFSTFRSRKPQEPEAEQSDNVVS